MDPSTRDSRALELTVLNPALNEADNLRMLLPDLRAALDDLGVDYEILVAPSMAAQTDDTEAVASALDVRLLHQSERGYGGALIEGFHAARGITSSRWTPITRTSRRSFDRFGIIDRTRSF